MMIDSDGRQERLGFVLEGLRQQLREIDSDAYGTITLDREQAEALLDAIDLVDAIRSITVGVR